MSRTTAGAPEAGAGVGVATGVVLVALPELGRCGAGGFPHPIKTMATSSERTPR